MKYFLLLLLTTYTHAQMPKINFEKAGHDAKPLYVMLGVEDENAVIVKVSSGGGWVRMAHSYFAFLPDGRVYSYTAVALSVQTVIKKTEVTAEDDKQLLKNTVEATNEVDKSQLEIPKDENGFDLMVNDAPTYLIEIYKGELINSFTTYAPEDYIAGKYAGYEMRQKFLDIATALDPRKFIVAPSIETVQGWDAVYIDFDEGLVQDKEIIKKKEHKTFFVYFYYLQHGTVMFKDLESEPKTATVNLSAIQNRTINYDFFLKHGEAGLHAFEGKAIYIVDKGLIKKNKAVLRQVKSYFLLL